MSGSKFQNSVETIFTTTIVETSIVEMYVITCLSLIMMFGFSHFGIVKQSNLITTTVLSTQTSS